MIHNREIECLPPLMGFPEEEHCEGGFTTPFYTCVLNSIRVFVSHGLDKWYMQTAYNGNRRNYDDLWEFFFDTKGGLEDIPCDPITLQSLIYHTCGLPLEVKADDDERPAATVGADDSLLALHFKKRGTKSFIKW